MITLISPNYVPERVTQDDLAIASLALGFTIGFGWLTTWTAVKQTTRIFQRTGLGIYRSAYVWMIWLEIIVCLIFSIICWLYLKGIITPSFTFYFCILTTWALQVQFLLQIIINRCAILLTNQKSPYRLKIGVAILITLVNISVYNIWIPARLQISERYVSINEWWDRVEKGIYLIVDASLNFYFIRIVQQSLVGNGLTKYRSLVKFNMFLVAFSLSMDVLIISMMSLDNTFVYMQFHPLAYIVKLNIEMSMADLIGKVARQRRCGIISNQSFCDFDVAEDEGMDRHIYTSNNRARISIDGKERKYRPGNVPYAVELQRQPAAKFVDYNPGEVKRRAVLLSEPCSPSISQWRTLPREGGDQDDATLSSRCTSTCSVATGSFEQSRYWWSEDDRATRTMI